MSPSATSSERGNAPRRPFGRLVVAGAVATIALAAPLAAAPPLTLAEALALAFPGCTTEQRAVFLTPEQMGAAAALAGAPVESALLTRIEARRDGALVGTAYLDTHRVRRLPETLLVVVSPAGAVTRVEVLSFAEPPEYLPRGAWYAQLDGRPLDDELALTGAVRPVAGATLTARATVTAVRRVLAEHRVLAGTAP